MKEQTQIEQDIAQIAKRLHPHARKLAGRTLLLTGARGFLGNYMTATVLYLNDKILKKPCKIICVDNGITSTIQKTFPRFLNKNHIQITRDVAKPLAIRGPVDYIIHAAGIASPKYYQKFALETIDVAVNGTRQTLELAKKKNTKGYVFFSSSEIYGDPPKNQIPTTETYYGNVSSIGPRACYDESKRLGETLCATYHRLYKLPITIVRPFNVFGPGMRPHDYRVIPRFLLAAMQHKPLPVYTQGKQTRTFCYIADATLGFFLTLLRGLPGEAYNIGNDKNEISMQNLAKKVLRITHTKSNLTRIPYPNDYPQGEPRRRCPDITKAKKQLGFRPAINLDEGIRRMYTWCTIAWK